MFLKAHTSINGENMKNHDRVDIFWETLENEIQKTHKLENNKTI